MPDQISDSNEKTSNQKSNVKMPIYISIRNAIKAIILGVVGFFFSSVGKVLIGILLAAMIINFPFPSPDLRISVPNVGSIVEVNGKDNGEDICIIEVNGTANDFWAKLYYERLDGWVGRSLRALGVEKNIWLAVNNHDGPGQWWPQQPIEQWNGSWHSGPITIGGPGKDSNGREYDIAVIILDKRDNAIFKEYIEIGKKCNDYSPVSLPFSAVITDKVNVTRINRSEKWNRGGL